ncbi:MAG TPA: TolC family protein [Polyangiaceae bacterium]
MLRKVSWVVLAGSALLASGARGEDEAAPRVVRLDEARAYARAHQPMIRAALARVAAAQARAAVPRAQWQPQLGATAQIFVGSTNNTTAEYLGVAQVDLPRIGGSRVVDAGNATLQPYGSTLAAIGISQEVFDFGRIAAQSAAADALAVAARHGAEATTLDVDYDVEESFYAVLAAKAVLKASEDAYERTRTHRDFAKAGVNSRLFEPIELTRAEADLARFDIGRIRARGGVTTSQAVLAANVGAPDLELDASGDLPGAESIPSLSAALEQAAARDPRVAEALAKVRAQEAKTRAIYAEMRPDLSATATFSGRAGGGPPSTGGFSADYDGWVPSVPNWHVGLVFSWPIYDGSVIARGHASEADAAAFREDLASLRQVLNATVQRAYIDVEVARDALPGLERAVTAAVANYAQADARFKAGLGTSIELADAEALRTEAEINLAMGKFDLVKARAGLGRAISEGLTK